MTTKIKINNKMKYNINTYIPKNGDIIYKILHDNKIYSPSIEKLIYIGNITIKNKIVHFAYAPTTNTTYTNVKWYKTEYEAKHSKEWIRALKCTMTKTKEWIKSSKTTSDTYTDYVNIGQDSLIYLKKCLQTVQTDLTSGNSPDKK